MQIKPYIVSVFILCLCSGILKLNAQDPGSIQKHCGTRPPSAEWDEWFNQKVEAYKNASNAARSLPTTITIPVIVHVIHGNESVGTFPNISANQIQSQIKVFNEDFAGKGFNTSSLAATGFSTVGAANTNVTFCLAQFDPNGNALAEPGIDRVNYIDSGWQNPTIPGSAQNFQAYMDGVVKPATIWNPTFYFNIWVSDINPSTFLLGYATFPAGSGLVGLTGNYGTSTDDGIWIWSKTFGSVGTLNPTFNRGRTAVHETAHWLGLRHIGGDPNNASGDCSATDYCNDTPPQKGGFAGGSNGQNFGSPSYPWNVNVCGSPYGDMFMNFMDYTDDAVMSMFTPDQGIRIQTAMANGTYRSQLAASSVTQCIGLPNINFVDVQEGCFGKPTNLNFTVNGAPTGYTWTCAPSVGVMFSPNVNATNPVISYPSLGTYTVSAAVSNAIGTTASQAVVVVNVCNGIEKNSTDEIRLKFQPNPADDKLEINVKAENGKTPIVVKLLNSLGQEVQSTIHDVSATGSYPIFVAEIENGIYFILVQQGSHKAHGRLIVSH